MATDYPHKVGKYFTYAAANDKDMFEDPGGNSYDVSTWVDLSAQLVFTGWGGTADPTAVNVDIETSAWDSTDDNDWSEIISFTAIAAGTATEELKKTADGLVMNFVRLRVTFTGGTAPTWTGYVHIKHLNKATA